MQRILTWGLLIIFLASGVAKLAGLAFEQAAFARWGYPLWFMYAVGAAETLGRWGC
ncbi:DoxX family protein [Edwardsiella anguillarum]|nr:DoxX family protein [Edwardsiella anguillarum]